jgi:hypothetical protein
MFPETPGTQQAEVRKTNHNRQSKDTGIISSTRNQHKTNKAQRTI